MRISIWALAPRTRPESEPARWNYSPYGIVIGHESLVLPLGQRPSDYGTREGFVWRSHWMPRCSQDIDIGPLPNIKIGCMRVGAHDGRLLVIDRVACIHWIGRDASRRMLLCAARGLGWPVEAPTYTLGRIGITCNARGVWVLDYEIRERDVRRVADLLDYPLPRKRR